MIESVLKERIRELRKAKNITQGALANVIGVSETTISKWENGVSQS
ncbi:MAG: helix-turn-helix transcriptional regulator [Lachnospiraceae bacterium]|nr:helix-turn-helix transcriptional regulator [Lachnospiraceae bacterium]